MEGFVERMIKEYYGLNEKVEKLGKFIFSDQNCKLDEEERKDLNEQYYVMRAYASILSRRLNRQGYDVEKCCKPSC